MDDKTAAWRLAMHWPSLRLAISRDSGKQMQNDLVDNIQGSSDILLTTRMATAYAVGLKHVSRLKNRCSH